MSLSAAFHSNDNFRALQVVCMAIAFGATTPPAVAEPADAIGSDSGICTDTTESARKACGLDADSAYWLAVGVCQNQPNGSRRQACLTRANKDRGDARALCNEQFEARDDVCDDLGQAAYRPPVVPSNFVKGITNKYFPLKPGTIFIYQGETDAGTERVMLRVQYQTATILGVECTQVHDTVYVDGEVTEDTIDWYAQDRQGNVWYFGESTFELEDGRPVSVEGSWRAGVDGARPGIVMKAHPARGDV